MGRSPCCSKEGLNRGAWTAQEDKILKEYIRLHGEGRWRNLPKKAGLKRCGKSCRLRWLNYLRPDIKRGNISSDEEELIIRLHKLLGNRWSLIAGRLPGRTDNEIKNYWNTNLGKKLKEGNRMNGNKKENPMEPPPPSQTPKLDSNVVRTKASKCSKVLFINPLPLPLPLPNPTMQNKSQVQEETTGLVDTVSNNQMEHNAYDNNGFLSLNDEEKELSTDFLIDFNVGDLCLSDLLNSDFSNTFNFTCNDNVNNSQQQLSPCSDQPDGMLCEQVLNEWTPSEFENQNVTDNSILSLSSFLESSEED